MTQLGIDQTAVTYVAGGGEVLTETASAEFAAKAPPKARRRKAQSATIFFMIDLSVWV